MLRIQAPHCPSCGAPIEVPEGATRVTCGYCSTLLVIEADAEKISTRRPSTPPPVADDEAPFPEPDATLFNKVYPRFELSIIEQKLPQAVNEWFAGLELDEDRFAFVSLRVVDREGKPLTHPLEEAFEAVRDSLGDDGDPGLAANLALETLCRKPFDAKLEAAIVLFEPKHMKVTTYAAGLRQGLLWASGEEGRTIAIDGHHDALERKMLREASDHFSNGRPVHLAANDLILIPSAGYMGRGARGYSEGPRVLHDVSNAQLGEEPLRVVTLAKNAFWAEFQKQRHSVRAPVGDVRIAAVRAVLPPSVSGLPAGVELRSFKSRKYELSLVAKPSDVTELIALKDDRQVLLWLSGAPDAYAKVKTAVLAVLDGNTGDNENPRRAGRDALEAAGLPQDTKLAVIQLIEQHGRVKWFRNGWKQPLALGPRGVRNDGMQQFDEGGEATVSEAHRLFFPGSLQFEGQHSTAESLGTVWHGGKASRLYSALTAHWKTKKTARALEHLATAARSDVPDSALDGLALLTAVGAG